MIRWFKTILLSRLGPAEQSHQGTMATSLRGPMHDLQCTISDAVSSCVIYTTRGTYFAHLRRRKQMGESRWRRRSSDDSWQHWLATPMVHQWQEPDEHTPHVPLLLLRASISPGGDGLNSHGNKSLAARVWCCEQKFDKYRPLFIGVLGPTRREDRDLHFLSINRSLIWLRLEDFWKGMNFRMVIVWKPNFRPG
jgi:hypothetical protein